MTGDEPGQPVQLTTDALISLRFAGCTCQPQASVALHPTGGVHLHVQHDERCHLLWLAVARWN